MTWQSRRKLNSLARELPEGLPVDAAWLTKRGYSSSLRSQYVDAGWLTQPARRLYWRPRGELTWQQIVVSLQTLLGRVLVVGGRTALELQGYGHYVSTAPMAIHLHGPSAPPTWTKTLTLEEPFIYHNSVPLLGDDLLGVQFPGLDPSAAIAKASESRRQAAGLRTLPFGQWNWPMIVSAPERALLEALDELPRRETFHQIDMLMEGLSDLSPTRLQGLLVRCRSIKVKRLFFFFADRHSHAWLRQIDRSQIDLGAGKRMLVPGARLDRTYKITVPADF